MLPTARSTRLVVWLALGCHVLVAGGLPLPLAAPAAGRGTATGHAAKDRSRPFPCMDKPCGCATAAQCFANCCCFTPAERLAWARARGVEPAVLAALERRAGGASQPAARCCSTARRDDAACALASFAPVDPEAPEVCGEYRSLAAEPAAEPPGDHDTEAEPTGARVVILRDMLACGGIVTAWLACGAALPPPRMAAPAHDAPAGHVVLADDVAPSVSVAPSAPPPRVG